MWCISRHKVDKVRHVQCAPQILFKHIITVTRHVVSFGLYVLEQVWNKTIYFVIEYDEYGFWWTSYAWCGILGVVMVLWKMRSLGKFYPSLGISHNLILNGSRSLRFCICRTHSCFSIKSLHFLVSGSDFKTQVSVSLGFATRYPLYFSP